MKAEMHWREHIYVDMCHSLNDEGGYIGGICTLDANDELSLMEVIHSKAENVVNYFKLFTFFKTQFPTLFAAEKLAVSCDGDKSLGPEICTSFPNATHVSCIHHLLNLVSRSESDTGRIQLRRTAYAMTKEKFDMEKESLKDFPSAYMKIEHIQDERWALYAVPEMVCGRLSAQVGECFNSFMLGHGIRHCSTLKII